MIKIILKFSLIAANSLIMSRGKLTWNVYMRILTCNRNHLQYWTLWYRSCYIIIKVNILLYDRITTFIIPRNFGKIKIYFVFLLKQKKNLQPTPPNWMLVLYRGSKKIPYNITRKYKIYPDNNYQDLCMVYTNIHNMSLAEIEPVTAGASVSLRHHRVNALL